MRKCLCFAPLAFLFLFQLQVCGRRVGVVRTWSSSLGHFTAGDDHEQQKSCGVPPSPCYIASQFNLSVTLSQYLQHVSRFVSFCFFGFFLQLAEVLICSRGEYCRRWQHSVTADRWLVTVYSSLMSVMNSQVFWKWLFICFYMQHLYATLWKRFMSSWMTTFTAKWKLKHQQIQPNLWLSYFWCTKSCIWISVTKGSGASQVL